MHSLFQRSSLIAPSLFLFLSACDNSENLHWLPFLVHTQTRCLSTRSFHRSTVLTTTWVWTTVLSRGDKPVTLCGLTLGILMEILVLSSGIRVDTTKEEFWLFPVFFSLYLSAKPHSYTSVSAEYSRLFFWPWRTECDAFFCVFCRSGCDSEVGKQELIEQFKISHVCCLTCGQGQVLSSFKNSVL